MKQILSIILFLSYLNVSAQDGEMTGIDVFFMEDGFYDNLPDALANAEDVLYLDLSLQSPKLRTIPTDVYKLVNLKYLELGFNQIATVDTQIVKLTKLEVLGLDGNKYLKTTPVSVLELQLLKELHLKGTGLSTEQLLEIEKELPASCTLFK